MDGGYGYGYRLAPREEECLLSAVSSSGEAPSQICQPFLLTAFLLNKKRVHLTLTLGVDFSVVGFGPGPTIHASPGA